MIAPVSTCAMKCYKRPSHNSEGRGGEGRPIVVEFLQEFPEGVFLVVAMESLL